MTGHVAPANNYSRITSLDRDVKNIREKVDEDEAFWVADMNRPRESIYLWEEHLPDVKLFYAMKCCDEPNLLKFLADRGFGFDCASKDEIERILALGVDPTKIVFSHPLKSIAALKYAKEEGVERLVFDTEDELKKIMKYYPDAEVFLRVKPKFSNAVIQLSKKFGAEPDSVSGILETVKDVGANFIGFSFHVGSLCDDLSTFKSALQYVSELKRQAEDMGLSCGFVDIGGGFLPPNAPANNTFMNVAEGIQNAIEEFFGDEDVEFIGEPGRFVSSEYMDLHLPVISVKQHDGEEGGASQSVYVPDGIYGSFNAINYDHAEPHFEMYSPDHKENNEETMSTTLWGQTCDSADCVYDNMQWPKVAVGDIVSVRKFSAYTYSPTSFFNGFGHHQVFVVNEEDDGEM